MGLGSTNISHSFCAIDRFSSNRLDRCRRIWCRSHCHRHKRQHSREHSNSTAKPKIEQPLRTTRLQINFFLGTREAHHSRTRLNGWSFGKILTFILLFVRASCRANAFRARNDFVHYRIIKLKYCREREIVQQRICTVKKPKYEFVAQSIFSFRAS